MQDEVNEKTISLCINGGKISARILKNAMVKVLAKLEQEKKKGQQKVAEKREEKDAVCHGKQSMEKLMKQNCEISNIEVTDGNIKSFEKCARKYSIDFCLKKDTSISPPRYFVFFKARDVDVMTAAFREYTGKMLQKDKKPSVRKRLEQVKERMAKHREREKQKHKERGPEH
ncbi:MAG: PcfB family protein [Blautia sp.]|nr:PcfB family protein [Blautia sp.]